MPAMRLMGAGDLGDAAQPDMTSREKGPGAAGIGAIRPHDRMCGQIPSSQTATMVPSTATPLIVHPVIYAPSSGLGCPTISSCQCCCKCAMRASCALLDPVFPY